MAKKINNKSFVEEFPLFNGNKSFEVTDSATKLAISGLTEGIIKGVFNIRKPEVDFTVCSVGSSLNSNTQSDTYLEFSSENGNTAFRFQYINQGVLSLYMYLDPLVVPIYSFSDSQDHIFKLTINATDNNVEIDGVVYNENNGLLFALGSKTTAAFTIPNIERLYIGQYCGYFNSAFRDVRFAKGAVKSLSYESLDELTTYYSFQSDYNIFSASSPTVHIENTLLDLQYNNSNIDTSDNPKTVTAVGTESFGEGRFGEVNAARSFDGINYDTYDMTAEVGNLDVYTVSGWILNKVNSSAPLGTINNIHLRDAGGDFTTNVNMNGAIRFSNVNGDSNWNLAVLYGDQNTSDPIPQKGRIYPLGDIENKYIYVCVSIDYTNKTLKVVVDNENITDKYTAVIGWDSDLTSMESLLADRNIIIGGIQVSYWANCNIYNMKVRKYLISDEERYAEFKQI